MRVVKHYTTTTILLAAPPTTSANNAQIPMVVPISPAPTAVSTAKTTSPSLQDLVNGILELSDAAAAMAVTNQTSGQLEFKAGNGGAGGIGGTIVGNAGSVFSTMVSGGSVQQSDDANGGNGGRGGDVNVIICVSCNSYACPHAGAAAATDIAMTDSLVYSVLPATDSTNVGLPSDSPTLPMSVPTDAATDTNQVLPTDWVSVPIDSATDTGSWPTDSWPTDGLPSAATDLPTDSSPSLPTDNSVSTQILPPPATVPAISTNCAPAPVAPCGATFRVNI